MWSSIWVEIEKSTHVHIDMGRKSRNLPTLNDDKRLTAVVDLVQQLLCGGAGFF